MLKVCYNTFRNLYTKRKHLKGLVLEWVEYRASLDVVQYPLDIRTPVQRLFSYMTKNNTLEGARLA
jgi:hypothetical protein